MMKMKKAIWLVCSFVVCMMIFPNAMVYGEQQKHYDHEKMCQFLHVSEEEFMDRWFRGKSTAEIANEQGVSEAELLQFMLKEHYYSELDLVDFLFFIHSHPETVQQQLKGVGFTSLDKAIAQFEQVHGKVKLPQLAPNLPFTIEMGQYYRDEKNASLEILYVDEYSPASQYKITIHPNVEQLDSFHKNVKRVYALQDGTRAKYSTLKVDQETEFHLLFFEKNGFLYMLSHDGQMEMTPEQLIDIANSIEAEQEK
ncbi:hypothetical protein [Alkalihalobacillus sp. LMS39]|uniref:hypothetical protein n=1 Tax=Alkalihalobacillus sp. LMS39 TaxID=2924032 RepID=UPI001FB3BB64|nr:hypothetical protein [Alkalihalobacillus sp. LMS39]UOE92498.1 hypothetical protein MM271_14755 [Alkalihalobacillus sp. LMS39]